MICGRHYQSGQNASGSWPSNSQPLVSSNAIGAPVSVNFQNPIAVTGAPLTNAPPPTPFHQLSFFRDPQEKNPYSEQWNFGLERQIDANTVGLPTTLARRLTVLTSAASTIPR